MLKKLIASVVGATMLLVPGLEANARTPWTLVTDNGTSRLYIASLGTVENHPHHRMYKQQMTGSVSSAVTSRYTDCTTGISWVWHDPSKEWLDLGVYLPQTFGESTYKYVCPGY